MEQVYDQVFISRSDYARQNRGDDLHFLLFFLEVKASSAGCKKTSNGFIHFFSSANVAMDIFNSCECWTLSLPIIHPSIFCYSFFFFFMWLSALVGGERLLNTVVLRELHPVPLHETSAGRTWPIGGPHGAHRGGDGQLAGWSHAHSQGGHHMLSRAMHFSKRTHYVNTFKMIKTHINLLEHSVCCKVNCYHLRL